MPIPYRVARFNKVVTNRTLGRLAPWLPGFGVIHHRGRTSGRSLSTPVNVFRRGDSFVIALTYGNHTDWLRNVLAAGECGIETRGQIYHLVSPRLYTDKHLRDIPAIARPILRLNNVDELLRLHIAGPAARS